MKKRKRKIFIVLFILFFLMIIITLAPTILYKKEINTNPLPQNYKKGVYHVHSLYSDGQGSIDDITRAASELGLDFVILTDHGEPNLKSSSSTCWLNNVLLVGGTELSLHSGHLAAVGYEIPDYIFPPEPQEAIYEIDKSDGVCFISHPFDHKTPWTEWDINKFTGLEVLSTYSSAKNVSNLRLLLFPLQYMVNSNYALLNTLQYPYLNMEKWDMLNSNQNDFFYYGIYALDAHASLPITEKFNLNYPSYMSMFRILTVYVKTKSKFQNDPKKAAMDIVSSLKKGDFFNVIEAIASANGFDAYFQLKNGDRINMGDSTKTTKGTLIIKLPFRFSTDIYIKRNGKLYKELNNFETKEATIDIMDVGNYRIEVYVSKNKFHKLPWIITNPFFVGLKAPHGKIKKAEEQVLINRLANTGDFFKVEKNNSSLGDISFNYSEDKDLITTLTFKLIKDSRNEKNFWSALAARRSFNFSGYQGFIIQARSDKKRRFWMEFRTGDRDNETWYRHSFLVGKEWNSFIIPFDKFYVIYGDRKQPIMSDVNSIFISVNNANAYPDSEGQVDIKNLGVY